MFVIYNTGNSYIEGFIYNDNKNQNSMDIKDLTNERPEEKRDLYSDNGRKYFYWEGEKIYIDNYISPTICELNKILSNKHIHIADYILEDLFLACAMGNSNIIAFMIDANTFNNLEKSAGTIKVIPTEKRYSKDKWHYKITLEPYDNNIKNSIDSHDFISSELWDLIKNGKVKIVTR